MPQTTIGRKRLVFVSLPFEHAFHRTHRMEITGKSPHGNLTILQYDILNIFQSHKPNIQVLFTIKLLIFFIKLSRCRRMPSQPLHQRRILHQPPGRLPL